MIKITKVLNATDLGLNGSHGGITVGRPYMSMLQGFFGDTYIHKNFIDVRTLKEYEIQYAEYSSNGKTPNDRVTPIGGYAKDKGIGAGDLLHLMKEDDGFFIDFEKKVNIFYFIGKGKGKIEILNYDKFKEHSIKYLVEDIHEFKANYMSNLGIVRVFYDEGMKLSFNGEIFVKKMNTMK